MTVPSLRFCSSPTDEVHAQRSCLYVERNPVRSRVVRLAWRFKSSSAAAHVRDVTPPAWLDIDLWRSMCETHRWRQQLQRPEDEDETKALRLALNRGRPLAEDGFLGKLEQKLGRRLRSLPAGRPKTVKKSEKRRNVAGGRSRRRDDGNR